VGAGGDGEWRRATCTSSAAAFVRSGDTERGGRRATASLAVLAVSSSGDRRVSDSCDAWGRPEARAAGNPPTWATRSPRYDKAPLPGTARRAGRRPVSTRGVRLGRRILARRRRLLEARDRLADPQQPCAERGYALELVVLQLELKLALVQAQQVDLGRRLVDALVLERPEVEVGQEFERRGFRGIAGDEMSPERAVEVAPELL